ncbi:MAG: uracil-DNA glycosylase [Kiritimatiellae bacterium]|nr:uracil-DNA glycosylase [Kiritimatiellia bacterium]
MSGQSRVEVKQLNSLLDQTIGLLQQMKEDGEQTIELEPDVVKVLGEAVRPSAAGTPSPRVRQAAPPPASSVPKTVAPKRDAGPSVASAPRRSAAAKPAVKPVAVVVNSDSLPDSMEALAERIASCRQCPLHQWRTKTVAGAGCANPDVLFIGEGPGKDEDMQGIPFVGRSGELLTRMIIKMGYTRDTVFIGNIVKCRPTVNNEGMRDRPPTPEEMEGCLPYLKKQISLLKPGVLVLLGNTALQGLFGYKGITRHRGKWLEYEGIPTMPTYHPSYLLRNGGGNSKPFWEVWEDLCAVLKKLGKEPPAPGRVKPAQQALL